MSDNFGTTIPASPAPQAPAGPPTMQHGPQVVMVEKKRNGLATASLVLGIIALVFCWLPFANVISYLLAFIALGLGIPAVLKGRKHKVGMGVAIAGIVLALGSLVAATVVNTATVEAIDDAVATATVSEDEIDVEFGKAGASGQAGTGGSKLPDLPAEFSDTPFEKGVVGMARTIDPNSANSQFFIMFAPASQSSAASG